MKLFPEKKIIRIDNDICPVFGVPYEDRGEYSRSVDRTNNDEGYTTNNIQMMSWRANRIKHNATIDEIEQLLNFLKKINPWLREL